MAGMDFQLSKKSSEESQSGHQALDSQPTYISDNVGNEKLMWLMRQLSVRHMGGNNLCNILVSVIAYCNINTSTYSLGKLPSKHTI